MKVAGGSILGSLVSGLFNRASNDPLGHIQRRRGHPIEQVQRAREQEAQLLASDSRDAHAWWQCGENWTAVEQFDPALAAFDKALGCDPRNLLALRGRASMLFSFGRVDEAIALLAQALEIDPGDRGCFHDILFDVLCSPACTEEQILEWHKRFARQFEAPLASQRAPHKNVRDPHRRLRIGYLSVDLRNHVTGRIMSAVFAGHDRKQFEVHCYYDSRRADDFTRTMMSSGGRWHDMARLDDVQLARHIRSQEIDVLVDLSGHAPNNRILVFARKPAPIQVSYLDYSATTGMETIDYRITTRTCDTPGEADPFYTEKLVYLPDTFWLYLPDLEATKNAQQASADKPWLLLSALNTFYRAPDWMFEVWAKILKRLPKAHISFMGVPSGSCTENLLERFEKLGVRRSRVEVFGFLNYGHYMQLVQATDIALGPYPYNGATTMLDCLWNGVPVVCLRGGPTFHSSMGNCIHDVMGTAAEMLAQDKDDYIEKVVKLAQDEQRRKELRTGLPERMKQSPLMDATALTRALEQCYRDMWRTYCAGG